MDSWWGAKNGRSDNKWQRVGAKADLRRRKIWSQILSLLYGVSMERKGLGLMR